jgi:carbamoyltransferase
LSQIPEYLEKEYGITAPVKYYDHHYCHATSAYYTSNYDKALVVTLDGGGDGLSGSVYQGDNGRLTRLSAVDSFNSLGNFYSYITHLCGFKAESHEGKITGLAALGKPLTSIFCASLSAMPSLVRSNMPCRCITVRL